MERNYRILLQYDGTRYDGWQKQGNTGATIQGKLEAVLERMAGKAVKVQGSGRTDAGVHALGQVANFCLGLPLGPQQIQEDLNHYLPEDIKVLQVQAAPSRFHSRLNALWKTYLYRIDMCGKKDVFERKYVYGLGACLDRGRMEKAAAYFLGKHDFTSFCANKKMKKSCIREIKSIDFQVHGDRMDIRFTGDGFLQHMVRIMAGTLVEVGLGKLEPGQVEGILAARDRKKAGYTAPPEGLFLERVDY